jgi:hypothetical protein
MSDIILTGIEKNITIDQGSTQDIQFQLFDETNAVLDMTGYDLRFQVRDLNGVVKISGTIANGKLAWVTQALGKFKIFLIPTDTTSLQFTKDSPYLLECNYDIEVIAPTAVPGTQKPWYGTFNIKREITR